MKENLEEREFVRGFNQGYLLKQHRPDINLERFIKVDSEFFRGVLAGSKEYQLEQKRNQMRARFGVDKLQDKDLGRDR